MAKWDMYDAFDSIFGEHYDSYKTWMKRIDNLKRMKQQVYDSLYIDNPGTIGAEMREIKQNYQNLIDNFGTYNYGWKGLAQHECESRLWELRDAIGDMKRMKHEAAQSVMDAIDVECQKCADAALREVNKFSVVDKVTSTVDVSAQAAQDYLKKLIMNNL